MNIQYAPPVTPPVLSIKHLSKQFGARRILTDISLDIPSGEIFGFLGPNGFERCFIESTGGVTGGAY